MSAQLVKYKGFGLMKLAWAVSEAHKTGDSNKFKYVAYEHTKMGQELIFEIKIDKFRRHVGRPKDTSVGMTGLRWFIFRGTEWLELNDEQDYQDHVTLWERI